MEILDFIKQYTSMFSIMDVIDILVTAFIVYKIIKITNKTTAGSVIKGIIAFLVLMQLAQFLNLNIIYFLFTSVMQIGLLVLVILFQPELRRVLEQFGSNKIQNFFTKNSDMPRDEKYITAVVEAVSGLSRARDGALIVFSRSNSLEEYVKTGTLLHAMVTSELVRNIFFPKAPMHDGAVIIKNGYIEAAGCMLPLSDNTKLSKDLGMRHRAGVGISEVSDAVVIVVSEETGAISVCVRGIIKRHLSVETLDKLLKAELIPKEKEAKSSFIERMRG